MLKYAEGLLQATLAVFVLCFILAMSCSWDIVTQGEILKADDAALEDLEILEAETLEGLEIPQLTDDIPDSLTFRVFSSITIGGVEFDFVEMEVGELLEGQEGQNDTLFVDHRP